MWKSLSVGENLLLDIVVSFPEALFHCFLLSNLMPDISADTDRFWWPRHPPQFRRLLDRTLIPNVTAVV